MKPSQAGMISQSGGLVWHMRAWHYRKSLWAPIISALARWTLPAAFCARFETIVCVDLDPLAPWLFRYLHRHLHMTAIKTDVFTQLPSLLAAYPHHAVLLSNILGQHGFHCADPAWAEQNITAIKHRLFGRAWGQLSRSPLALSDG